MQKQCVAQLRNPLIENEKLSIVIFLQLSQTSISCFLKILNPYSRFPRSDKTDLKDSSARVVSKVYNFGDYEISRNQILFNMIWDFSNISWSNLVGPNSTIMVSGGHGHSHQVQKSRKLKLVGPFGKWKLKLLSSPWSRIRNSTELLAFPKFKTQGKNGLADPIRPQIGFFL